jgi:UDP-GlcNAc:undecaprenyl-phosphate GlcNAc-1-phosphate transferase
LPVEVRLFAAALVSIVAVWLLAPLAMRIAARTGFLDEPQGYKVHAAPTPYLGGAAVMAGFAVSALVLGTDISRFLPILACAAGLAVLGTIDDRTPVRPRYRVIAEIGAALVLTAFDAGWTFLDSPFETFLLNAIWILGFTNAFNLMDNMDGASATVGAVCAAGLGAAAIAQEDFALAAFALALSGACAGFLRFNLRPGRRARIFLGDGGSMPLGFTLAVAVSQLSAPSGVTDWPMLLAGGMLLSVLALDTLLVIVSRTRRSVSLALGGHDHLTHRLKIKLGSPARVAAALAVAQLTVSALCLAALEIGRTSVIAAAFGCLAIGVAVIAVIDRPEWAEGSDDAAWAAQHAEARMFRERHGVPSPHQPALVADKHSGRAA